MKFFEMSYIILRPCFGALQFNVNKILKHIVKLYDYEIDVLDIGGRKSHYTIGLKRHVTITDIQRTSVKQKKLNLGLSKDMINQIKKRRSNIRQVIFDDFTCSALCKKTKILR